MRTLVFITGRTYDFAQEITATSEDGRIINFKDPSRGLAYTFRNWPEWYTDEDIEMSREWDARTVMSWYDGDRTNRPEV